MKLLLDESLPRHLKQDLSEFDVWTVPEMGWSGKNNGDLLSSAENEFDIFLTADQNIQNQQTLENYNIAVVVLVGKSNRYADLQLLVPSLIERLDKLEKGKVEKISM